jgi:phosphonate metabolism protein PhnN/1,5-bisphosphokinase (PRPP-forming)
MRASTTPSSSLHSTEREKNEKYSRFKVFRLKSDEEYLFSKSSKRMPKVYYIVGPSGEDKDSLIGFLRLRTLPDDRILFAHRYVTGQLDFQADSCIHLSDKEFSLRLRSGLFSFQWEMRDIRFAIGSEIRDWLKQGFNVIVPGCRKSLRSASSAFGSNLCPVIVNTLSTADDPNDAGQHEVFLDGRLSRESLLGSYPTRIEFSGCESIPSIGDSLLQLIHSRSRSSRSGLEWEEDIFENLSPCNCLQVIG